MAGRHSRSSPSLKDCACDMTWIERLMPTKLTLANEKRLFKSLITKKNKISAVYAMMNQYIIAIFVLRVVRKNTPQILISKAREACMHSILPHQRYRADHDIASHMG